MSGFVGKNEMHQETRLGNHKQAEPRPCDPQPHYGRRKAGQPDAVRLPEVARTKEQDTESGQKRDQHELIQKCVTNPNGHDLPEIRTEEPHLRRQVAGVLSKECDRVSSRCTVGRVIRSAQHFVYSPRVPGTELFDHSVQKGADKASS